MSKKKSRVHFVLISIIILIGIFFSVCKFDIPFTDYTYNGFINSIQLGLDLSGGVSAVYEASAVQENQNLSSGVDATVNRIQNLLSDEGYSEAIVTRQGDVRIRVEVPDISDPEEVFELIGEPQELQIKTEDSVTATAVITGKDVVEAYASQQQDQTSGAYTYGVVVKFNDEGRAKFADLTTEYENKEIYIYLGSERFSALTVESVITGGSTFISGGSISDKSGAEEYALRILSGTFSVELTLLESSVVSATLGSDALFYGIIAGAIGLVLIMIIMWIIYGDFGLLADLALVCYTILVIFFLQAIPGIQLTLPGIAGIILSMGMAVDANIIIFERIKEEYRSGKKLPLATKVGFKRAFAPIFDSNITTIIAGIILYIFGSGSIKGFAITLLIGIVLSMFSALVLSRWFVKLYLPLNSTNVKRLRLKKEADNERA